jgi:hypothetical protein
MTGSPGFFSTGQRFARQHGFVHRTATIDHHTVHRNLLARPDEDNIPDADIVHGHLRLHPVTDDAGGLRAESHQFLDRLRGATLGARFEEFPEFDERDDDRGGLEINMPAQQAERDRQGVEIGGRGTHCDQHVHVGGFVAQRLERAHIVLPADVELHGRGKRQHQPVRPGGGSGAHAFHRRHFIEHGGQEVEITRHREHEQRHGKDQTDDEQPPLFIDLMLARFGFGILHITAEFHCFETC